MFTVSATGGGLRDVYSAERTKDNAVLVAQNLFRLGFDKVTVQSKRTYRVIFVLVRKHG